MEEAGPSHRLLRSLSRRNRRPGRRSLPCPIWKTKSSNFPRGPRAPSRRRRSPKPVPRRTKANTISGRHSKSSMRIERIDLYLVAMPLIYPWRTAYGEDAAIHSVLCRLTSGSLDAWGETTPFAAPCYSPEWAGGVFAVARDWLAPAIVGQPIASGEELQQRLAIYK